MEGQSAIAQPLGSPAAQAAEFRAARIAAARTRFGVTSGVVLPSLPTADEDEADDLRRSRNADRFANGVGSPLAPSDIGSTDVETEITSSLDREAVERYAALQSQ